MKKKLITLVGLLALYATLSLPLAAYAQTQPTIGLGGGVAARTMTIGGVTLTFVSFKLNGEAFLVPSLSLYGGFEYTPLVNWGGTNINASFVSGGILYQLVQKGMNSYFGVGVGLMDLSGLFSSLTLNALVGGSIHLSGNLFAYAQLEATSVVGKFAIEVGLPVGIGLGIMLYL